MRSILHKAFSSILLMVLLSLQAVYGQASGSVAVSQAASPGAFPLVSGKHTASIVTDASDAEVVKIAASALQSDINLITGISPELNAKGANQVIIGTIGRSKAIQSILSKGKLNLNNIKGKWECFSISVVSNPLPGVQQALVIAGSDPRGTAFGVFELSKRLGVSPFYWWADIKPEAQSNLFVKATYTSAVPSVKYRGIFLNDEDWGLQPWAAKTFEPETGDIGPKTYAKIFELLLRLKANLIWPAMHPSTKAFYHYPGNKKVAADYAIVVGSSHAEPMLRNNVGEWNKSMGNFNYQTNKETIQKYWESRVQESKQNEAIYTLGMRGVHDSGMEGVKGPKEAAPLVEQIIGDQREMLKKYINPNVAAVPQAFTVYKEVLEVYDYGVKVPEDVTIVWPDDNYGYIHRLNNSKENSRSGGSGVYYHASYWGRPHDYLWLSSTHPGLIREEMIKAYETGSTRIWVLNVGDIKPLEYNTEFFLDMAYNAEPFRDSRYTRAHLQNWASTTFGQKSAAQIADLMWRYYQLAFERRPEFMGWSQTEPTTQTRYTDYNHFYYGDEAESRIGAYEQLVSQARILRAAVSQEDADAYYQLVYYPVAGASLMTKKFLYRDKAFLYGKQDRSSAADYAALSKQAYEEIIKETDFYNNQLSGGKWKFMMSMAPRELPVYKAPVLPEIKISGADSWSIAPEGFVTKDSSFLAATQGQYVLPAFNRFSDRRFFVDVFLTGNEPITWLAEKDDWIKLSQSSGTLSPAAGKRDVRIWVSIDWNKIDRSGRKNGKIQFRAGGRSLVVNVGANNTRVQGAGYIEDNGLIAINAAGFSRKNDKAGYFWKEVEGVTHSEKGMQAFPYYAKLPDINNPGSLKDSQPSLEYDFYTLSPGIPSLKIFTAPTHPVNNDYKMRYAISIDSGPPEVLDFKTVGRSEEWKQNVLRNSAIRDVKLQNLSPGKHTLKVYMIDPGVILDRIVIDMGGYKKAYSTIPETQSKK